MTDLPLTRVALSTGVELDVAVAGEHGRSPVILLHGFPESHRTWRHQIPALAERHFVLAPDQRGYARSDKPEGVDAYKVEHIIADAMALADHFNIRKLALVGHDWGGAAAWGAALAHPTRVGRLAIVNAPHPLLFQRAILDDPAQRAASQYMRAFREPQFEKFVERMGMSAFFDRTFAEHAPADLLAAEKPAYMDQWSQPGAFTAMLNWYRAAGLVVPAIDEEVERPAYLDAPFPRVRQPTLVIWGMQDKALPPAMNADLADYAPRLQLVPVPDAGHFVPWEKPDAVTAPLLEWLDRTD